jgi:hypothetical protein
MIKNITLSADGRLISQARLKANCENKSLNVVFRDWLNRYVLGKRECGSYKNLMKKMSHIQAGDHFNRDELNER